MPAYTSGTHRGHACAIVGSYADESAEQDVDHVGLLAGESEFELGERTELPIYHMRPPFEKSATPIQLLGLLVGLSKSAILKMEQWASDMLTSEHHPVYHVRPASITEDSDTPGGPPTYLKFSCAGFVERCYRDVAGIQLVVDEENLPPVELDTLKKIWPAQFNHPRLSNPRVASRALESLGLSGESPWRILMPAYLFHAIRHFDANGRAAGPYQPRDGDWQFG